MNRLRRACVVLAGIGLIAIAAKSARADFVPVPKMSAPYQKSLREFAKKFIGPALMNPRLFQNTDLAMEATPLYLFGKSADRKRWVKGAYRAWSTELADNGVKEASTLLLVMTPSGGDLWRAGEPTELVQSWDDRMAPYTGAVQEGRFFVFGGGQFSFGNATSVGINGRFGKMVFHNRADFAFLLSYSSLSSGGTSTHTGSFGAVARMRNPLTKGIGWNFGGQLVENFGSNVNLGYGLLLGVNFLVNGRGSWDMTIDYNSSFSSNEPSSVAFLVGYTAFLNN